MIKISRLKLPLYSFQNLRLKSQMKTWPQFGNLMS